MKEENRVVYIAKDGRCFITELECADYEASLVVDELEDLIRARLFEYGEIACPDESDVSKFIMTYFNQIKSIVEGE